MSFGASGLCLSFGGRQALRDVDLAIPTGQVTAIVGGDGAGKSSLLHCLAGTVAPDAGSIVRPDKRHLGSMPAQSGTWGDLTVDENLSFAASAHGIASATFAERRDDLLERATLTGARDRLARDLSGGMRRKLGFIVAVLHRPELLLLDEPSTGVDPVSRVELWRLIAEAAASGTAVAMATTYLDEAERASSVLVLDEGTVLADGPADAVVASVPGRIVATAAPTAEARAWRRGRAFHEWQPSEGASGPDDAAPVDADLEDAVIALMLARREAA
ncbi:MAG: ABC transporter ATP-binding protein [Acidimicrobiales bacterium]|nr:ABC transporter ATP-binding protein [Acidimicrobiales bacterium]